MDCDGSTTNDDSTEDEEDTTTADAKCSKSLNNNGDSKTKCQSNFKLEEKGNDIKCSDWGSEVFSTVWHKGHRCLAPYSGDNEYYEAVISSIQDTNSGQREAVVTFIGYESEGSEVVPVTELRKITTDSQPNNATLKTTDVKTSTTECTLFFTHLKGNETKETMRLKYGEYDAISESAQQKKVDSRMKSDHTKTKDSKSFSNAIGKKKGKLNVSVKCNKRSLGRRNAVNKKNSLSAIQDREQGCEMIKHKGDRPESPNTAAKPQNISFGNAYEKNNEKNELDVDNKMIADGFDDQDMERPFFTEPALNPSVPFVLSKPGVSPTIQIPATINRYLREYQRDGVSFLFQHYSENTGAILGDDMGLGKTVQVISFIAAVLGKSGTKADVFRKFMDEKASGKQGKISHETGTFLVVSPGSVMFNWRDELETWGHFKTGLFHGTAREATLERASRGRLDVVLTTYETMRNHLNDLNRIKWLAVIMDEVHRLKDPKAQITVAAKELNVKRRYGLTGTPLQNKLEEFWCVLDWANPGSLGSVKKFKDEFGKPMLKGQTFDATKRELAVGRKRSKDLRNKIGRWFLRRTKDLIADQLPKKDESVVFCPLTPFQEDVYQTLLQNPDVELIRKKNFPCDCGSGKDRGKCCYTLSSDFEEIKTVTMRFFQLLLKVANHAALLAPTVRQSRDQQEKAKELCLRVFARYPEFSGCAEMSSFELLSDPKYCGKMKVLEKLMRVFQEEHSKLLLFSRSTQLLNILEEFVISKGLVYSRLDGGTKPADRTRLVHEFNVDPSIFVCLISTKAGGLGLNFTGANVVIIFDPNWNPSNDLQAQDRAYRIGQRRDVRVYRLISLGTIEEMMYLRQVYKQQLANIAVGGTNERRYFTGVVGDKDRKGELFGLENLFSYRAEGASLSKDIVRRREKLEAGYRVAKYELIHDKKRDDDLQGEVTSGSVNPKLDEDPYNLGELASQFVDDQPKKLTQTTSEVQKTQNYDELRFEDKSPENKLIEDHSACAKDDGDSRKEMESKGDDEGEILYELDNSQLCLSDNDNFLGKFYSKDTTGSENFQSKSASRKYVSFELSSSSGDDDDMEEGPRKRFTRIREKESVSYTRIPASIEEDSCDVIPPTASLHDGIKSRITNKRYGEDSNDEGSSRPTKEEDQSTELRNSSGKSSSSDEDDSDEGLFSRAKRRQSQRVFRKRKPVDIPESATLKEGRRRFRRFPGKKAYNIKIDSNPVTAAKKSRKEKTVEEILESCGVHYTHANRHIVGPSEAENRMSKQALQDVFELRQFSQQPANCFPALETSDESDDLGEGGQDKQPEVIRHAQEPEAECSHAGEPVPHRSNQSDNYVTIEKIGNSTVFIGSTPRGIRRQHFREMSDLLGFTSEVDLAKAVVDSSESDRREMLKRYYVHKNPVLSGLASFTGRSLVKNEKRKQAAEDGKRFFEGTRGDFDHEASKISKRNVEKRKSKPLKEQLHCKTTSCEDNVERRGIHGRAGESKSQSKQLKCATKALRKKQNVREESCVRNVAVKEEGANYIDTRNSEMPIADGQIRLEQNDVQDRSTATTTNEEYMAELRGPRLENTSDFSFSILDEFLMSGSTRRSAEIREGDRGLEKWTPRSSNIKKDKQLDKTEQKETTPCKSKKNTTSLLDEFI